MCYEPAAVGGPLLAAAGRNEHRRRCDGPLLRVLPASSKGTVIRRCDFAAGLSLCCWAAPPAHASAGGCGLAGWMCQDNGYGKDVLGPAPDFIRSGRRPFACKHVKTVSR
jgi:hypothetical protein